MQGIVFRKRRPPLSERFENTDARQNILSGTLEYAVNYTETVSMCVIYRGIILEGFNS